MRIGILGHVGNGNLGDEAIISVVIQNIRRRYPGADIRCFTSNPDDTQARHGVPAFPIRRVGKRTAIAAGSGAEQPVGRGASRAARVRESLKARVKRWPSIAGLLRRIPAVGRAAAAASKEPGFLWQSYGNLRGVDLLIIAGSQQLIDYVAGGAWGHPYTIFKWVVMARARRASIAFMSCGAGPIESPLGRFFIRKSLALSDFRSYRDEISRECVEAIGAPAGDPLFPDLAYGLIVEEAASLADGADARRVVAINPLPFVDPTYWVGGSDRNYELYIGKLAEFALWLGARGYGVLFFPTQLRADPPVIDDIRKYISKNGPADFGRRSLVELPIRSFADMVAALSVADVVVATRFHGLIMSYLLNKPALGIAYAGKTNALMEQMGQGMYALDIQQLELNAMQERFADLEMRGAEIKKELRRRLAGQRRALEAQYVEVFRLLEPA